VPIYHPTMLAKWVNDMSHGIYGDDAHGQGGQLLVL
jgi:hypothetical protein